MKPNVGVALIAAKSYYFGVGGGTKLFADAVRADGTFEVDTLMTYKDGVSNVRELLRVRFKNSSGQRKRKTNDAGEVRS